MIRCLCINNCFIHVCIYDLGDQSGDRLLDIPCLVCGDRSSGKHYGIYSCDGELVASQSVSLIR